MSTVRLVRCVTLAACVLLAHAQSKDVILNVTAVDAKGHPVTDLTSADFQIFDQGKVQHIASFQASAAIARETPSTTLIFFDLLNVIPGQREYESSTIIHALEPLETGDSVYLYLLTNHGDLYPVHALPTPKGTMSQPGTGTPWTQQIHPLLDRAIRDVYGLRPMTDKDEGIRTSTTLQILGELGSN
jgi:VWFA-related protein